MADMVVEEGVWEEEGHIPGGGCPPQHLQKAATPRATGDEHGQKKPKNSVGQRASCSIFLRIDIAPHTRPRRKPPQHVPDPDHFHIPPHAIFRD